MTRRSTNLDVRAYAQAHGVRLRDIAYALGITPSEFSIQYMRMELPKGVKDQLKQVVRDLSKGE